MTPRPARHLAMTAVAALALVATTACAGSDAGNDVPAPTIDLVDTAPAADGDLDEVTWLLAAEPAGFDTDRAGGDVEDTIVANVCERVFQQQPDLSIEPWLASSYEQTDDALVLELRDDATFHDGSPITADDVVYSLRRHAEEGNEEADEFENVAAIRSTGPQQVTLDLARPDSQLVAALAGDAGIVLDEATVEPQGEDYGTPGSTDGCSGPYRVASWSPGTDLTLERHDDYWNDEVRRGPAEVTFVWADSAAAVNTLTTGAASGTYLSSPSLVPALAKNDAVATYFGPSTLVYSLVPTERGGMTDARLRRALSLALDREGIAVAGFKKYALPATLPVGQAAWGYEQAAFEDAAAEVADVPTTPTDDQVAEAKQLVEDAGSEGREIVVASDGSPYRTVISNAVQAAGHEIGLDVRIETMSEAAFDEFYSDPAAREAVDLVPVGWYISKADPTGFYDNMVSGSGNNWIGFSSPSYDQAVTEAKATAEPEARADAILAAQAEFMEEMLWIPVVEAPNTLVLADGATGPVASVAYLNHPWLTMLGSS